MVNETNTKQNGNPREDLKQEPAVRPGLSPEEQKEQKHFEALRTVIQKIRMLQQDIPATEERCAKKRLEPTENGLVSPEVLKMEQEIQRKRAELTVLEGQQTILRDRIPWIFETMVQNRTELLPRDLDRIIWYPSDVPGDPFEYSTPDRRHNSVAREKNTEKPGEYVYWCMIEKGADTRFRVYLPGEQYDQKDVGRIIHGKTDPAEMLKEFDPIKIERQRRIDEALSHLEADDRAMQVHAVQTIFAENEQKRLPLPLQAIKNYKDEKEVFRCVSQWDDQRQEEAEALLHPQRVVRKKQKNPNQKEDEPDDAVRYEQLKIDLAKAQGPRSAALLPLQAVNPNVRNAIQNAIIDTLILPEWNDLIFNSFLQQSVNHHDQALIYQSLVKKFNAILAPECRNKDDAEKLAKVWATRLSLDPDMLSCMHGNVELFMLVEFHSKDPVFEKNVQRMVEEWQKGKGKRMSDEEFGKLVEKMRENQKKRMPLIAPIASSQQAKADPVSPNKPPSPAPTPSPTPAPVATAPAPAVSEKKEEPAAQTFSLIPLLQNLQRVSSGTVNRSRGRIGEYAVLVEEKNGTTTATLETDDGEKIPLRDTTVHGLNTAIMQHEEKKTILANPETDTVVDPFEGKHDEIAEHVFGIDMNRKVVTKEQFALLEKVMRIFFLHSAETLPDGRHPLRALGLIRDDDTFNIERARQFQQLCISHPEEIQSWTFADMLALTHIWDERGAYLFVPQLILRGEVQADQHPSEMS